MSSIKGDHAGIIPPARFGVFTAIGVGGVSASEQAVIYDVLNEYLDSVEIFWCMTAPENRRWMGLGPPDNGAYGFNYVGTGDRNQGIPGIGIDLVFTGFISAGSGTATLPGAGGGTMTVSIGAGYKTDTAIRNASQCIAAADSQSSWRLRYDIFGNNSWNWGPSDRHSGGSNVLFGDGHVQWELMQSLWSTPARWNDDNLDVVYGM